MTARDKKLYPWQSVNRDTGKHIAAGFCAAQPPAPETQAAIPMYLRASASPG